MRKLVSIIMVLFMISCGSKSGGATDPQPSVSGDTVKLKIRTVFYDNTDGIANDSPGGELVNVGININGAGSTVQATDVLETGIDVPKGANIEIDVTAVNEDEGVSLIWLGYPFEEEEMSASYVEIIGITKDISLTLIVAEGTTPISPAYLILSVKGEVGGKVAVNGEEYEDGDHYILFVKGTTASLEAILPDNENIAFLAFDTSDKRVTDSTMDIDIKGDTPVIATFYDVTDVRGVIKISVHKDHLAKIKISIGNTPIETSSFSADGEYRFYTLPEEIILGETITLKVETIGNAGDSMNFLSWSDDISGFLSGQSTYTYTVVGDATITPTFGASDGQLVLSIRPRTNYYGNGVQHKENTIDYRIRKKSTSEVIKVSKGLDSSSSLEALTWRNNIIQVKADETVELVANQGVGFYNSANNNTGDGSKVKWTGTVLGAGEKTGLTQTFDFATGESKTIDVNFEIEKKTVSVDLKKEKLDASGNQGFDTPAEDAKGYIIKINGKATSGIFAKETFDWHTKVTVEIVPGEHYSENKLDISSSNGEIVERSATKVEYYIHADEAHKATITHNSVEMTLNIKGGNFGNEADTKYKSSVDIKGTGTGSDKSYGAGNYSVDGVSFSDVNGKGTAVYTIKTLSGIPVNIDAKTTAATVFVSTSVDISGGMTGSSTTPKVSVTNKIGQSAFAVTTTFMAPVYTLKVRPLAFVTNPAQSEGDNLKAGVYEYTVSSTGTTKYDTSGSFTFTNGIPQTLSAVDGNLNYDIYSVGGVVGKEPKTIILTNDTNTTVEFKHKQIDVALNIIGGKDDRNTSYVEISGTGLSSTATKCIASNRNMRFNEGTGQYELAPRTIYTFKALSGIKDQLKVVAVNSKVHNFHKIVAGTNSTGAVSGITFTESGMTAGTGYNPRIMANYKILENNTTIVKELPSDNSAAIEVNFRINSLGGSLNGIKEQYGTAGDDYKVFVTDAPLDATVSSEPNTETYIISRPEHLMWFQKESKNGNDFSSKTIKLDNDIYLGENEAFEGITSTFKSTFDGAGYAIVEPKVSRAIFNDLEEATINRLFVVGGHIATSSTHGGLIGSTRKSGLMYITNAARITGNKDNPYEKVGGIIGNNEDRGRAEYLVNFSHVYGEDGVGGIIGYQDHWVRTDNYYFANRGHVTGDSYVGGIIGDSVMAGNYYWNDAPDYTIEYQYVYNTGDITAKMAAGGIIGNAGWGKFQIKDSYNTGTITSGNMAGGMAGTIRARRNVNGGAKDSDAKTWVFIRGYNIGRVKGVDPGAIVSRSSYVADGGHHKVYFDYVYADVSLTDIAPGNDKSRFIYSGIARGYYEGGSSGSHKDAFDDAEWTYFTGRDGTVSGYKGTDDIYKVVGINAPAVGTDLPGFADNTDNWAVVTGTSVNGYTSRPQIKNMLEADTVKPAWLDAR